MIRYTLAAPEDDAVMRALLRDNAMPSWVSMASTREPSYFAGADRFGRDWAVVARDGAEAVGMYACAEQPVHLNGQARELGYLGSLRVAPRYRHRLRIIRDGFASIRALSPPRDAALWYTAIATDNLPARRLLEAGLRGMPRYRAINDFLTLALPRARGVRHGLWRPAQPDELDSVCQFHNRHARHYQFAPVLTPERAQRTGAVFHLISGQGGPSAVMALWNQQPYKQIAACAYRPPLGALLPLYNLYARAAKRVALPPVGGTLDQTYLAFLAVAPARAGEIATLIEDALAISPSAVLTLGLHAGHGWLDALTRAFRPASYRTRIYAVEFGATVELDQRPAQPEVALL